MPVVKVTYQRYNRVYVLKTRTINLWQVCKPWRRVKNTLQVCWCCVLLQRKMRVRAQVHQEGANTYFCQGFHCTTCRSRCLPWIQHPWYDERSRGVILKGREIKGFLDSGMAGIYEVKREPGHMVEHLSTAALDLAMLRAQSQHHRFGPDEKCLTS